MMHLHEPVFDKEDLRSLIDCYESGWMSTGGNKVKAFVFFRGRTIVFKERGEILLLKLAQELADYGVIEQMPKLEGKRMIMMINSKKK